jgi:hypothetical protein
MKRLPERLLTFEFFCFPGGFLGVRITAGQFLRANVLAVCWASILWLEHITGGKYQHETHQHRYSQEIFHL